MPAGLGAVRVLAFDAASERGMVPAENPSDDADMVWAFLERWNGLLVLQGIAKGDPNDTINAVDDAFGEARASILDVHFFSGVLVSFSFEVEGSAVETLGAALGRAGVVLDADSLGAMREASKLDRAITGTLAVTLAHGDPDIRHEIPKVPG